MDKKQKRYELWGFPRTSCRVLVPVFFCSVTFLLFVLHQPVTRRLSGGLLRHPRHHQTAERRRCARPLQCDVIDDTIKLLNDDAALELFVCNIVTLAAVVSCVRKTHIWCFCTFTTTRLLRRFRRCLGRLLCGGRVAATEGTAREAPRRCLLRDPAHQKAAGRRRSGLLGDDTAWLPLLQVWGVKTCSPDTWQLWFSYLVFLLLHVAVFWFFEVGRRAAAAPGAAPACHRRSRAGELPRHTPQSHFSVTFLVMTRDGSSLLFFDCGFCSVLLAVFFWFRVSFEHREPFISSFEYDNESVSDCVGLHFVVFFIVPKVMLQADDITAYEYLLTFRIF